jgi:hypothetical protein
MPRRIILGVRDAARDLTLDAIDTLAAIMKDPKAPAAARISAAVALLDLPDCESPAGMQPAP